MRSWDHVRAHGRCVFQGLLTLALWATGGAAGATDRVQQYLALAQATLEHPITPAELEAAVLSSVGTEDIAGLFEKSLAARVSLGGSFVTPELGGEATLHRGKLRFVECPDPLHPVVRRLVELKADPEALLRFLSGSPQGERLLKTTGGLHALLFQMTSRPEPDDAQRRALERVVSSALSQHFKTWSIDPEQQVAMIRQHDWEGRYAGFWHLHPPRPAALGFAPGIEPSAEDMAIAMEKGQFLTLVFQPDGFDLYDLSPLAAAGTPDLGRSRIIRHRSRDWSARFRRPTGTP